MTENKVAYFAKINEDSIVEDIISIDANILNPQIFIAETLGMPGRWILCNQENSESKKIAGVGHTYSEDYEGFVPPQPWNKWTFNTELWDWEPPTPDPSTDTEYFSWDEEKEDWVFDEELTNANAEIRQLLEDLGVVDEKDLPVDTELQ